MTRYRSYKPRSIRKLEKRSKRNLILSIIFAAILIYLILTWGLPTLVGGLSVFNKLKPTQKAESVVEDSAIAPPVLNIPYEATNSATINISGFASAKSRVEIYLDNNLKSTTQAGDDGSFTARDISLSTGTNNIYGVTINESNRKSLASKTIKLLYSNEKPKIEVSEPADGKQIKGGDKKVKVSGTTDPTNNVTVNGSTVIVSSEGSFATEISINEGDNTVVISATSPVGNSTQVERKLNYSSS